MGRYDRPLTFSKGMIKHARNKHKIVELDPEFICWFCKQPVVTGEIVRRHYSYMPHLYCHKLCFDKSRIEVD